MTMIPGAWERRRPSSAVGNPAVPMNRVYDRVESGRPSGPDVPRAELPGWLKVSIFAAMLIAVMWLVMSAF
jgi:hypothetical protein